MKECIPRRKKASRGVGTRYVRIIGSVGIDGTFRHNRAEVKSSVSIQSLHSAPEKAVKEVGYARRIGSVSSNPDRCFFQGSRTLGFGALELRANTIREPVVILCERAFSQRIYSKAEAGKVVVSRFLVEIFFMRF